MNDDDLQLSIAEACRRYALAMEATSSVALSHPPTCACVVCRAADGDIESIAEVLHEFDPEPGS